jgi:hypothetical protein
MATQAQSSPPCPRQVALDAYSAHCRTCHPCGMRYAGIGRDRYAQCPVGQSLDSAARKAPCTCPPGAAGR